jgi:hypothetical protein
MRKKRGRAGRCVTMVATESVRAVSVRVAVGAIEGQTGPPGLLHHSGKVAGHSAFGASVVRLLLSRKQVAWLDRTRFFAASGSSVFAS